MLKDRTRAERDEGEDDGVDVTNGRLCAMPITESRGKTASPNVLEQERGAAGQVVLTLLCMPHGTTQVSRLWGHVVLEWAFLL